MSPNLSDQQIADANAFMAARFIGTGVYMGTGQFVFSKEGDDVILTDTNTNDTLNLGPEAV